MAINFSVTHRDGTSTAANPIGVSIQQHGGVVFDATGTITTGVDAAQDLVYYWSCNDTGHTANTLNVGVLNNPNPNFGWNRIWAKVFPNAGTFTVTLVIAKLSDAGTIVEKTTHTITVTVANWSTAAQIYVDPAAGAGSQDGTSMVNAFLTLEEGWNEAYTIGGPTEVIVKAGAIVVETLNLANQNSSKTVLIRGETTTRPTIRFTQTGGNSARIDLRNTNNVIFKDLIFEHTANASISSCFSLGSLSGGVGDGITINHCLIQRSVRFKDGIVQSDGQGFDLVVYDTKINVDACDQYNVFIGRGDRTTYTSEASKRFAFVSCDFAKNTGTSRACCRADWHHKLFLHCKLIIDAPASIALYSMGPDENVRNSINLVVESTVLERLGINGDALFDHQEGGTGQGLHPIAENFTFDGCHFISSNTGSNGKLVILEEATRNMRFRNCLFLGGGKNNNYMVNSSAPAVAEMTSMRFDNCGFYTNHAASPGGACVGVSSGLKAPFIGLVFYNCASHMVGVGSGAGRLFNDITSTLATGLTVEHCLLYSDEAGAGGSRIVCWDGVSSADPYKVGTGNSPTWPGNTNDDVIPGFTAVGYTAFDYTIPLAANGSNYGSHNIHCYTDINRNFRVHSGALDVGPVQRASTAASISTGEIVSGLDHPLLMGSGRRFLGALGQIWIT